MKAPTTAKDSLRYNSSTTTHGGSLPGVPREGGWVPVGELVAARHDNDAAPDPWRSWKIALPLWWKSFWAGGMGFCRAAERQRRRFFVHPVRLSQFLALEYARPPTALHHELASLRAWGVREVLVPLRQEDSAPQREQALTAIHNLHAEGCHVGAVLIQSARAAADPASWAHFCHWAMAQAGGQLHSVRVGCAVDQHVSSAAAMRAYHRLFSFLPDLRHAFPGVAMTAPEAVFIEKRAVLRMLHVLAPENGHWDGLTLQAPAWQASARDDDADFVLRLAMAAALASAGQRFGGKVTVCLPAASTPAADEGEGALQVAQIIRRVLLSISSGVVEKVALEWDAGRQDLWQQQATVAVTELMARFDGARFVRRLPLGTANGLVMLEFVDRHRTPLLAAWATHDVAIINVPFRVRAAADLFGQTVPLLPYPRLRVTRLPTFFFGEGWMHAEERQ